MVALIKRHDFRDFRALTGLLLAATLLFPASLGAEENFLRAYKDGLAAFESRDWEAAAEKMREAVAGRSEESGRLLKKGYMRRYLPHYYLGMALAELGECSGALESLAESERQGVVQRRKLYDDLVRSRERCEGQVQLAEQIGPLKRQLTELESRVRKTASLAQDPQLQPVWTEGSPSLASLQSSFQSHVRQARTLLDELESGAGSDLLKKAETSLAQAREDLQHFDREAAARRTQVASRPPRPEKPKAEDSGRALTQQTAKAAELLEATADAAELQDLRADLERLHERARQDPPKAGTPAFDQLLADLERSHRALERALDRPPQDLDLAARAFLDGDYPRVVEGLSAVEFEEPRAQAHVHLLRAAALFALHHIRHEEGLLSDARAEARAALAVEPGLTLPERFFSPQFRELFETLDGPNPEE